MGVRVRGCTTGHRLWGSCHLMVPERSRIQTEVAGLPGEVLGAVSALTREKAQGMGGCRTT